MGMSILVAYIEQVDWHTLLTGFILGAYQSGLA